MGAREDIAGTVVLYNPDKKVVDNISTYINQVKILLVIDNSDNGKTEIANEIKNKFENVEVISNQKNLGIAKALNQAVTFAKDNNFKYLLTMDQDTPIPEGMVYELYKKICNNNRAGIISPFHDNKLKELVVDKEISKEVLFVMTCGNLINVNVIHDIGGFDDKLFIDYVDHDICLRLNKKNYKVIQDNSYTLNHSLGNRKVVNLVFFRITPSNHNAKRLFYRTRNRFYIYKKYKSEFPTFVRNDKLKILKEIVYLSLFENNKLHKLKMMSLGYIRYLRNDFSNNI